MSALKEFVFNPASISIMVAVGLVTGIFSGVFGVGGGVVLVPMLVLIFKYPPHTASGTSLIALLLPVGLLGAIEYYKAGRISGGHIKVGLIIAIGLFFGAFFGAKVASLLPANLMQKLFALFLLFVAAKLWFSTT